MSKEEFLASCAKQWDACPNPERYMVIVANDDDGKVGLDGLWCAQDIEILTAGLKDVYGIFKS